MTDEVERYRALADQDAVSATKLAAVCAYLRRASGLATPMRAHELRPPPRPSGKVAKFTWTA